MKPKSRLYTKKQIKEAIAFWTTILENTSPLIDALVEDFGYDVVFGEKKVLPSLKMIEDLYSIINIHLFGNALAPCPIKNDKYGYCRQENAAMGYNSFMYDDPKHPNTYTLLTQPGQDSNGNIYYPPAMYVADETFDTPISLVSLASIVAHEMIHQYITEIGNGCKKQYDNDKNGIKYDVHDNDEFMKWIDIANSKHGLHVTKNGSKLTYDADSVKALKKFAGSDYPLNEHEEDGQHIRKTSYGTRLVQITYF